MGKFVRLFLIFLASALVTVVFLSVHLDRLPRMHIDGLPGVRHGGSPRGPRSGPVAPSGHITAGARHASAQQLAASGRYREAQDVYLSILHDAPADAEAMQGLVAVRRQLAGGDATVLRRQAAAFRQAIATGVDMPDHYSPASMEMLARACSQAAAAIEGRSVASDRTQTVTTSRVPPGISSPRSPGTTSVDGRAGAGTTGMANRREPAPQQSTEPQTPNAQKPPDQRPRGPSPAPVDAQPATPQSQSFSITLTPPSMPPSPPPPAGSENSSAAQPSGPSPGSSETIAVVSPPSSPAVTQSQGDLVRVDCQKRAFVLRGSNGGDEEYLTTASVAIYIRGAQSERLRDFCGLQGFLGHLVVTWSAADGDRRIARWVSVILN